MRPTDLEAQIVFVRYNLMVLPILLLFIACGLTCLDELLKHTAAAAGQDQSFIEKQMKQSVPMKRFGKPEEIASVISFLASPAASYVNGVNIAVDGGRTPAL